MYELRYSAAALRSLEKFDKDAKVRILLALERLRIRPESCDIRKLVGREGFRFRVGDYRVIFIIEKGALLILVLEIGHRKDIYA